MKEIVEINDTKSYTCLSTFLIKKICNQTILSSRASSLWMLLYSLSCANPSKSYTACQSTLASLSGCSLRSISRAVAELRDKGFVNLIPKTVKGIFYVNTYEPTIPKDILEEAGNEPDKWVSFETKDVSEMGDEEEKNLPSPDNGVRSTSNFIFNKITQCSDCDFSEKERDIQAEVDKIESEIELIEEKVVDAEVSFSKTKDFSELMGIRKLKDEIFGLKSIAEKGRRMIFDMRESRERDAFLVSIDENMSNDYGLINNIPGSRVLSRGLMWWIRKKMKSYGIDSDKMIRIFNEIVYVVRFGSLKLERWSSIDMPLMRAINICLKLLREGKWQTPVNFYQKIHLCFQGV